MKKLIILSLLIHPQLIAAQAFLKIERIVYFETNSSRIDKTASSILDELLNEIKTREISGIEVVGHTDERHNPAYNSRLGMKRAEEVKKYLIDGGVDNKLIATRSDGETNPVVKTKREKDLSKNRRVTIIVTYYHKLPMASRPGQDIPGFSKEDPNWQMYKGEKGSLVFIKPTSFEEPLTNMSFNITEALDPCDMIRQNLSTVSTTGECLQSAGMLFLDIRDKTGKPVKPKAGETVQIWIPATNYDPTMEIYLPLDGQWKSTKLKPTFQQRENKSYYVIETTFSSGWNLDRPICPCPANGPKLIVRSPGKSKVYVSYAANNLSKLPSINKNEFKLSKKVEKEDSTIVTVTILHKNKIYMVHKPLSEIKKRKNGAEYIVKRRDFVRKNPTDPNDPEKDLCDIMTRR